MLWKLKTYFANYGMFIFPEDLANDVRECIDVVEYDNLHSTHKATDFQKQVYDTTMKLFSIYSTDIDAFLTFDDYGRFVTTVAEDFLGF